MTFPVDVVTAALFVIVAPVAVNEVNGVVPPTIPVNVTVPPVPPVNVNA